MEEYLKSMAERLRETNGKSANTKEDDAAKARELQGAVRTRYSVSDPLNDLAREVVRAAVSRETKCLLRPVGN